MARLLACCCLLLVLGEVTGNAEHLFPVFRGLKELKEQHVAQQDQQNHAGRRLMEHTHEFTHEASDTNLHVSYTAVQHERHSLPLLGADIAPTIKKITCMETVVTVECVSPEAAQSLLSRTIKGDFMSGACVQGKDPDPRPIYKRVWASKVSSSEPPKVIFETTEAHFQELFEDIDLVFKWSPPHKDPLEPSKTRRQARDDLREQAKIIKQQEREQRLMKAAAARKLLFLDKIGGFFNDLGDTIVGGVNDAGDALTQVVNGVVTQIKDTTMDLWVTVSEAVKTALQGAEAGISKSLNLINLNYDRGTRSAANTTIALFHTPWIKCSDCYATVDVYIV